LCEEADVQRTDGDDAGLLLASARGDDHAFATFYRRWLPLVTGYFLRRTGSRELAFDLAAETFAAVVADLARFDPERGSAPGWLFEIAEHKLLDSMRRDRVESSARLRLGHEPVVLEDRDLDERSYSEIAGEMDCSEAVVRQRAQRGLSRLQERMKETS
jgi:DNA-directed RNA polymerase specialized sigma24 family protein